MHNIFFKNSFYNKGQSLIGIIVVFVVAVLLGGSLYYYFSKQIPETLLPSEKDSEVTEIPVIESESEPEPEPKTESKADSEPKSKTELEPEPENAEISKENALAECRLMPAGYDKEECFLYSAFWFKDKTFCDEVTNNLNKCICHTALNVFLEKSKTEQEQLLKGDFLDNEEIKQAIAEQCPETVEIGAASRNATRMAETNQIKMAQEMYWGEENQYYQSASYPLSIPNIMAIMPTDPLTKKPYGWIDNTENPQKFCVYADLENKGFYVSSQTGSKEIATKPLILSDCE